MAVYQASEIPNGESSYDEIAALLDDLADDVPEIPEPITPARTAPAARRRVHPTPTHSAGSTVLVIPTDKTGTPRPVSPMDADGPSDDGYSVGQVVARINKTLALAGAAPMSFHLQSGLSPSKHATPGAAMDAMTDLVTRLLLETTSLRDEVEDLQGRLRNEKSGTARVQSSLSQARKREVELAEYLERERMRSKKLDEARRAENKQAKKEVTDIRNTLHKAVARENQAMSETKSMRKDFGRMQDRLHNALSEKTNTNSGSVRTASRQGLATQTENADTAKPTMTISRQLHDGQAESKLARIEEFLDSVAFGYEHRQRELQSENEQLRDQLFRLQGYVEDACESINLAKSAQENAPVQDGPVPNNFLATSPEEVIENEIRERLAALQTRISQLRQLDSNILTTNNKDNVGANSQESQTAFPSMETDSPRSSRNARSPAFGLNGVSPRVVSTSKQCVPPASVPMKPAALI